jgi:dipeptidyl aminopeptidase/acylaminoacyl peptidase
MILLLGVVMKVGPEEVGAAVVYADSSWIDGSPLPLNIQALGYLREELDLPSANRFPSCLRIPILIGHGDLDEKVGVKLGLQAASCLSALGVNPVYKEYENLGHWYSGDMLADIVTFLRKHSTTIEEV